MADATDWVSLTEAHNAINLNTSDTTQDTELALYITGISRRLDTLVGPAVIRAVSDTLNGGRSVVFLTTPPVSSISSVTEYTGTSATSLTQETISTITTNQYVIETGSGILRRRNSGSDAFFPAGRHNVLVSYSAGRYSSTTTVDARFKEAAAIMLAQIWRREQGFGSATFGAFEPSSQPVGATFAIPNAVKELLADQMLPQGLAGS